jgi:hypothetical protein
VKGRRVAWLLPVWKFKFWTTGVQSQTLTS